MRNSILAVVMTATAFVAAPATAEQFDGKRPLLCSAFRLFECDLSAGCVPVTAEEIGAAGSWTVDFKKKEFTGTTENALPNAIEHVELLDGKLFLSGVQDGLAIERDGVAWSVSINNPDGVMAMAVVGEGFGIIGLGSCVTR
jgi:hypothetical protein